MKPSFTPLVESLPATIPFVAPEAIERRTGIPFKVRVGANESAFGISPRARAAMDAALDRISHYNDPENHDLRDALSGFHNIPADNISVGAGIDDLLGLAVRAFLQPGDSAVSSFGSYPTFHFHVAGFGAESITSPYLHTGFNDLDALADTARKEKARLVYLANPDNPAGTWFSFSDIQDFIRRLPENCACIVDEAYVEFAPGNTALPIANLDSRTIIMRTFSKAYGMAGARVGYAIASPEIITAFNKIRLHFNVNLIAQAGATAAIRDKAFLEDVIRAVEEGRNEYVTLAGKIGLSTLPSATNFVTFDCGIQPRAQALLDALAVRGVFVRKPGTPPLDRCIRVTVGTTQERETLMDILPEALAEVDASK